MKSFSEKRKDYRTNGNIAIFSLACAGIVPAQKSKQNLKSKPMKSEHNKRHGYNLSFIPCQAGSGLASLTLSLIKGSRFTRIVLLICIAKLERKKERKKFIMDRT